MRWSPLLVALAALALVVPQAGAQGCMWTTTQPEVVIDGSPIGKPTYYYDSDCGIIHLCQMGPLFSVWIYEESNGLPGLQRGDEMKDDTCNGMIKSDTIIF